MATHSRFATAVGCLLLFLAAASATAGNLECLGGECHGRGYAVYRSSDPGGGEWRAVCGEWKTDFVVLDDDRWQRREENYRKHCPHGAVVYAGSQRTSRSLDRDFLAFFDQVIARARAQGRKVLFHCKLGVHRTGRLAAYYELKHEGWSLDRALEDFDDHVPFLTRGKPGQELRRVDRPHGPEGSRPARGREAAAERVRGAPSGGLGGRVER